MQIIKAGGPADVIAHTWFRMGYRPRNSLVAVAVHGDRMRLGATLRFDLVPNAHRRRFAEQVLAHVGRTGPDGLIVLVDGALSPQDLRGLVAELKRQARRADLELFDVIALDEDRWRAVTCRDPRCCSPQGYPLTDVMRSPVALQMLVAGRVLRESVDDLLADVEPDASPLPGIGRDPAASGTRGDRLVWLDRWEALLAASGDLTAQDVAWLVDALDDVLFRDAVIYHLTCTDARAAALAVLERRDREDVAWSRTGVPDEDRVERGRRVLSAVARSVPEGRRAEALAVLAWLSWWTSEGTRGRLLAERALADRPGHRLAPLVLSLFVMGLPPSWVRDPLADPDGDGYEDDLLGDEYGEDYGDGEDVDLYA